MLQPTSVTSEKRQNDCFHRLRLQITMIKSKTLLLVTSVITMLSAVRPDLLQYSTVEEVDSHVTLFSPIKLQM